ncbi:MAG: hypothetical protein ABGW76_04915 [Mesonia sp.]|uniref:hypothetical protein n=1 Tax=Mesonia sp. TaxID=1960830 RepID=UPI003241E1CC
MREIPHLFNKVDFLKVSGNIIHHFQKLGDRTNGQNSVFGVDGIGSYPFSIRHKIEDFEIEYPRIKWNSHRARLKEGFFFDSNYNQINESSIVKYYKQFSNGFFDGYDSFESEVSSSTSLFKTDTKVLKKEILKRVIGIVDPGYFRYEDISINNEADRILVEKIKSKYNIDVPEILIESNFYESGYSRGTYFKAWEIILTNYSLFESSFNDLYSNEDQKEKPQSEITLKSLFKYPSVYDDMISRMIDDKILIKNENTYSIDPLHYEENNLELKRLICAFGFILHTKSYLLNTVKDVQIIKALSIFFNIKISRQTYSKSKNECFINGNHKAEDYFVLYSFLS